LCGNQAVRSSSGSSGHTRPRRPLAREDRLTRESSAEQQGAGLTSLSPEEVATFERYNAEYRDRFWLPVRHLRAGEPEGGDSGGVPAAVAEHADEEVASALAEIDKIAALRLQDAIWESTQSKA
jgi:2-oxo-4-hydroxy-4-carboxy-5-ureidoimidazoline decarboxylase